MKCYLYKKISRLESSEYRLKRVRDLTGGSVDVEPCNFMPGCLLNFAPISIFSLPLSALSRLSAYKIN